MTDKPIPQRNDEFIAKDGKWYIEYIDYSDGAVTCTDDKAHAKIMSGNRWREFCESMGWEIVPRGGRDAIH